MILPTYLKYIMIIKQFPFPHFIIDNFLTDEEISSIQLHATQWDQLSGLEHVDEDGRIEPAGRTSSKAWCNTDCLQVSLFY